MSDTSPSLPSQTQSAHDRIEFLAGIAALIGAAFAMSISPSLVRFADVGPLSSAFWRVFLALPILWMWMRAEEGAPTGKTRSWSLPVFLSGLFFAGDLLLWHLAIMKTTIANATFFATMAPLWVVIFGWLVLRQKAEKSTLAGLGLCLVGGGALVYQSMSLNPAHAIGDALGIGTGVFFGLYFLAVGAARKETSAARVTFEMSLVTVVILLAAALVIEGDILPHTALGWGVLFALAFVSHAGGQGLLSIALGRLPTIFSSLVIFIEAIAAAGFAWVLQNEPVSVTQAIGGAVILAGIWIARPRAKD
ncbi:DMT family transporter [Rhizobium sp. KVB221]|uniref:DMT family transporter n=1 Tax=Rhizobium setariae TaxID=2801340 RepID=A0A936YLE4_9HYPH|nr:DMT family transporter [Rhizobium setariae]MBL0370877.1 DMT family transporter [Rhizobium setariae]